MQQDMAHCKKRVKEEKRREYWDVEKFHTELKLGQWHFGNGKYQDAIDSFVEALKRLPDTMKESQVDTPDNSPVRLNPFCFRNIWLSFTHSRQNAISAW